MPGLVRGIARTAVVAGTATAVSNRVSRRQAGRWANQEAQAAPPPEQYAPPAPREAATSESISQLKQLADLRDQGVLTEEEFQRQKTLLLG